MAYCIYEMKMLILARDPVETCLRFMDTEWTESCLRLFVTYKELQRRIRSQADIFPEAYFRRLVWPANMGSVFYTTGNLKLK